MPRPKNLLIKDFFTNGDKGDSICNNDKCVDRRLNKHAANLERHLKTLHPKLFSVYIKKKCNQKKPKVEKIKIVREINKKNIELAIIELFTKNERPLSMTDDLAFKILVQPAFDALNLVANRKTVSDCIVGYSNKLKNEIISDLREKLLSLKIATGTKSNVSVLAVHVQYIKDKKICARCLAVRQLKSSHTSSYLKSVIIDVLKKYSVDLSQILTITTDNCLSMIETVTDLDNEFKVSVKVEYDDEMDDTFNIDSFNNEISFSGITNIRCAAQTLQICMHEVMKNSEIKENLEKCRFIVSTLRNQKYLKVIRNERYAKPIIDSSTWNSTYCMLQRLLELKELIQSLSNENTELIISPEMWKFIEQFTRVFQPCYDAIIKLQSDELLFTDIYIFIMDIFIQIENMTPTNMTTLLKESLNKRKNKLFENEIFIAALYLDPRIKVCLSLEQKEKAKQFIRTLYDKTFSIKGSNVTSSVTQQVTKGLNYPSTSRKIQAPKSFSDFLENLDSKSTIVQPCSLFSNLETDFVTYDFQQRIPLSENILDYWDCQNNTLSEVAMIILAIPPTQVNVEKLFTSLKHFLNDKRNRLTWPILEHILLVQANGSFEYEK